MKKPLITLLLTLVCLVATAVEVNSPSGNLSLTFDVNKAGKPFYTLKYKGNNVIEPSFLGFKFANGKDYSNWFTIVRTDTTSFTES